MGGTREEWDRGTEVETAGEGMEEGGRKGGKVGRRRKEVKG